MSITEPKITEPSRPIPNPTLPQHWRSMLFGALALVVALIFGPSPVAAQDDQAANPESPDAPAYQGVVLEVADQTTYVVADGALEVELRWTGPRNPDLTISATIFAPVEDQDRLESEPSDVRNRYPAPDAPIAVTDLPVSERGNVIFTLPVRSFNSADDQGVWLEVPGVYPVSIEIRSPEGPAASIRTNLIRLPTETSEIPLAPVGVLLNVSSADGFILSEATEILERHPNLALTVVLEDGVLSQLASDAESAERFRQALGERAVTAVPALGLDPSALAAIDQSELYRAAIAETAFRFESVGLNHDEHLIALETTVTDQGADLLASLGVDTVVQIGPGPGSGTISTTEYRTESTDRLTIVEADDARMQELHTDTSTTAAAHDFLASLTVRFQNQQSPIVLGGPEIRLVPLRSLEVILDALDQPGPIQALPIRPMIDEAPLVPFRASPTPQQDLGPDAAQIETALALMTTYEGFYQSGGTSPIGFKTQLLASLSRDRNREDRALDLSRVINDLNDALGVISLPENQSITLAARQRPIPLSISNDSSGDRNVLLRFESDRIDVAQNDQVVTVPPGASAIEIDVEALSLGVSPLDVEVWSPDGTEQLASTRFQVRSTAIPGLGYLISGAALVFLIAWWVVSASKARAMAAHPASQHTGPQHGHPEGTGNQNRTGNQDPTEPGSSGRDDHDVVTAGGGRPPPHNRRATDRRAAKPVDESSRTDSGQ